MGDDLDKSILEHIFHIVVIGNVAGTDRCQVVGIKGIEILQGTAIATLQPPGQSFFLISDEKPHLREAFYSKHLFTRPSNFSGEAFPERNLKRAVFVPV